MNTQIPTIGRIVHYHPNGFDKQAEDNQTQVLPAIVTHAWEDSPTSALNLSVFSSNPEIPVLARMSVQHIDSLGAKQAAFWDWPPMVPKKIAEEPKY